MGPTYPIGQGLPEYANAEEYDEENAWGPSDDFYLELAKETGGPVLDVGCGTGMLVRAIVQTGIDAVGLDVTPAMIERARKLSDEAGLDIEWVIADARTMELGRKFKLIYMTGHAFQHLLSDEDIHAFFERAREHLLDDGTLAFETRNFAAKTFGGSEEPRLWKTIEDSQGRQVDLLIGSTYDPETGVEVLIGERFVRENGERTRETSSLRYVELDQLSAMLGEHGFEVVEQYGNWQKGPVAEDQPEYILICRLSV